MSKRLLGKRRARTTEQEAHDEGATKSSSLLYFDSLESELVSETVIRISDDDKFSLLGCDGVLRDAIPRSITMLSARVVESVRPQNCGYDYNEVVTDYGYVVDDVPNLESMKRGRNFVMAWGRFFLPDSRWFVGTCHYLRSLELDLNYINPSDFVGFNLLFAACGDVLEDLHLSNVRGRLGQSIIGSIRRHCRALNALSLEEVAFDDLLFPLFCKVGAQLRKLSLIINDRRSNRGLEQWCPALEDIQLYGFDVGFALVLKSPLKVVRFISWPSVSDVASLIEQRPDVRIHLRGLPYKYDAKDLLRTCGEQLEVLTCTDRSLRNVDIEKNFAPLENLKELRIVRINSDGFIYTFLDAFFRRPKSKLRKLFFNGANRSGIFDYLASKTSTLRELTCVYHGKNGISDAELSSFLSTNEQLETLSIHYGNSSLLPESIIRQTSSLLRSLNRFPALSHVKIDVESTSWVEGKYSKKIGDACVGLRGRGITVEVGKVLYLQCTGFNGAKHSIGYPSLIHRNLDRKLFW